jgi:hypothetical protein
MLTSVTSTQKNTHRTYSESSGRSPLEGAGGLQTKQEGQPCREVKLEAAYVEGSTLTNAFAERARGLKRRRLVPSNTND